MFPCRWMNYYWFRRKLTSTTKQGALNSITRASDGPLLNVTQIEGGTNGERERETLKNCHEKLKPGRREQDTGCTHGQGKERDETCIVHHLNDIVQ